MKNRQARNKADIIDKFFEFTILDNFINVLDAAVDVEVSMECMRQTLNARKDFDIGKAFLTMVASQRNSD